jgi:uroporphyrinogen decarboxylase
MPVELTAEETTEMFSEKVDRFFGFESEGVSIDLKTGMNPLFEEEVLERRAESVVMRGEDGIVAERYLHDSDRSSIPHFLEFPIKGPGDWPAMRERYRIDDPDREAAHDEIRAARRAVANGSTVRVSFLGFYGQLRNWMGMQPLSYAFYDHPSMIHEMVEHWAELCARRIEALPSDIVIDRVDWWEDMASKTGPLVSPAIFREFLQPGYHRVMGAAKRRGCVISQVDCDGDPYRIVANWLEEGVNIMFPVEVAAGSDPHAWREEFGLALRLRGGIAKRSLVEGERAIDRELERIKPLFEQGGYVPHLDHLVPADIPYGHYCQYLEKKRRLIGR